MHAGLEVNDWQTSCRGLSERLGNLLAQGLWTDCTLVVGSGKQKMPAHRVLLGSASPVLAVMLFGPLAKPKDNVFHIPNIEPDIFNRVLEYIYTDDINLTSCEVAYTFFEAAHYLNLPEVEMACISYLLANVSSDTVLPVFEFAEMFNQQALRTKCLTIMRDFPSDVLDGAGISAVRADTLTDLFARVDLRCHSEMQLFTAAERWVRAQLDSRRGSPPPAPGETVIASSTTSSMTASTASNTESSSTTSDNETKDIDAKGPKKESDDLEKKEPKKEPNDVKEPKKEPNDVKEPKKEPNDDEKPKKESSDVQDSKPVTRPPQDSDDDDPEDPKLMIRPALYHIRFLTIEPMEFARHNMTTLLSEKEILAISLNLMHDQTYMPMPKDFSTSREERSPKKTFWAHFNLDQVDSNEKVHSPQMCFHNNLLWRLYLRRNRSDGADDGCVELSMLCDTYDEDTMYLCDNNGFVCDARVKITLVSCDENCQITWIKEHKFIRAMGLELDQNKVEIDPVLPWSDLIDFTKGYTQEIEKGKLYITFKIEISYASLVVYK